MFVLFAPLFDHPRLGTRKPASFTSMCDCCVSTYINCFWLFCRQSNDLEMGYLFLFFPDLSNVLMFTSEPANLIVYVLSSWCLDLTSHHNPRYHQPCKFLYLSFRYFLFCSLTPRDLIGIYSKLGLVSYQQHSLSAHVPRPSSDWISPRLCYHR